MTEKLCIKCAVHPRVPGQRWCRDCRSAYRREHPRQATETEYARTKVRAYANVYKQRGKLIPAAACEACGEPGELVMLHPDWDRPLLVVWVHEACGRAARAEGRTFDLTAALLGELRAKTKKPRLSRSQRMAAARVAATSDQGDL